MTDTQLQSNKVNTTQQQKPVVQKSSTTQEMLLLHHSRKEKKDKPKKENRLDNWYICPSYTCKGYSSFTILVYTNKNHTKNHLKLLI